MAERKSFLLRMDPALWDELESWAQAELRSVNGQIEYILRQAVNKRKGESPFRQRPSPSRRNRDLRCQRLRPGIGFGSISGARFFPAIACGTREISFST